MPAIPPEIGSFKDMSSKKHNLNVAVIGPTGLTGSHVVVELLNRGHTVTGISRNPNSVGTHKGYKGVSLNVFDATTDVFAAALKGHDVVICTFGPHTGHVVTYVPFVEGMRKIVLAVKAAVIPYFVMIGGTGSTILKSEGVNCCDSQTFWVKYFNMIARAPVHVAYMERIMPPEGAALRKQMYALRALDEERATPADLDSIREFEQVFGQGIEFVKGCRTSFLFFLDNKSFHWTFISPPANYCPSVGTGKYVAIPNDFLPVDENGDYRGIATSDLAIALADEAEDQKHPYMHWTVYGDQPDMVTEVPIYLTLKDVKA